MEFQYSNPVDPDYARALGASTIFHIRIHKSPELADKGTMRLLDDWAKIVGDGREKSHLGGPNAHGHLIALGIPECLPERLPLAAYLNEFGFLYDGI